MTTGTVRRPLARLADHLLPDGLQKFIEDGRARGLSWDRLAKELWAATDQALDANGATVRLWAIDLGIEKAKKSAA